MRLHCTRASDWLHYLGTSAHRRSGWAKSWQALVLTPDPARASLDVTSTNRELSAFPRLYNSTPGLFSRPPRLNTTQSSSSCCWEDVNQAARWGKLASVLVIPLPLPLSPRSTGMATASSYSQQDKIIGQGYFSVISNVHVSVLTLH